MRRRCTVPCPCSKGFRGVVMMGDDGEMRNGSDGVDGRCRWICCVRPPSFVSPSPLRVPPHCPGDAGAVLCSSHSATHRDRQPTAALPPLPATRCREDRHRANRSFTQTVDPLSASSASPLSPSLPSSSAPTVGTAPRPFPILHHCPRGKSQSSLPAPDCWRCRCCFRSVCCCHLLLAPRPCVSITLVVGVAVFSPTKYCASSV